MFYTAVLLLLVVSAAAEKTFTLQAKCQSCAGAQADTIQNLQTGPGCMLASTPSCTPGGSTLVNFTFTATVNGVSVTQWTGDCIDGTAGLPFTLTCRQCTEPYQGLPIGFDVQNCVDIVPTSTTAAPTSTGTTSTTASSATTSASSTTPTGTTSTTTSAATTSASSSTSSTSSSSTTSSSGTTSASTTVAATTAAATTVPATTATPVLYITGTLFCGASNCSQPANRTFPLSAVTTERNVCVTGPADICGSPAAGNVSISYTYINASYFRQSVYGASMCGVPAALLASNVIKCGVCQSFYSFSFGPDGLSFTPICSAAPTGADTLVTTTEAGAHALVASISVVFALLFALLF